jgi:transcriptional regulator with XRE-family HTH domain
MTSAPGGPASPAQIARNGHIAALLRTQMAQRNWTARDFNARMGLEVTHTSIYVWLNAKGAPGPTTRPKVAKLLGVAEAQLMPRDAARDAREAKAVAGATPSTAVAVRPATPRPAGVPRHQHRRSTHPTRRHPADGGGLSAAPHAARHGQRNPASGMT